jgi:hypothetical protein
MVTQPSATSISGAAFAVQPAVQLRDASGNNVSQSGIDVSVGVTGGGATIVGTTTATTTGSGVATFSGIGITGAGTWTLTFSSGGLTSVTSSAVVVTEPATQLAMVAQPSTTAQSGATFGAQPAVQLRSAGGSPVNQPGVTVTAEVTGGVASLFGTTSASTNSSGIATFSGLGISGLVGTYTLTFKSSGLTDAVSNGIDITAGAAAKLQIVQQPLGAASGQPLSQQPVIQLLDAANNTVTTSGINITATLNDPGATGGVLSGGNPVPTNSSGTAGFATLAISLPGTYTITFSAPGLTSATSGSINVSFFFGVESQTGSAARSLVSVASDDSRLLASPGGTPVSRLNTPGLTMLRGAPFVRGLRGTASNPLIANP